MRHCNKERELSNAHKHKGLCKYTNRVFEELEESHIVFVFD